MRLKVKRIGGGLHHSETLISIESLHGDEIVVVDPNSIQGDQLEVGWPVSRDEDMYLVELPRPSSNGSWRIWVNEKNLIEDEASQKAYA